MFSLNFLLLWLFFCVAANALHFNATNFYVNSSCSMNDPFARITVADDPGGVSYQLFGSPDFLIHKHRGDIFMVKRPKDQFPLFYVSATDRQGATATAVVEVSHSCPTVSFDAVPYHFFALRRAPGSIVGTLKATGVGNIRYHTDSEIFSVHEQTGVISARQILPIDATTIFYVKASDQSGNNDVAEIVVEVIGCYLDGNSRNDHRYNVNYEKRCYGFAINTCEPGTVIGTIKAKGIPHPIYEFLDDFITVHNYDGIITVKKQLEGGVVLHLNILALNGAAPDNRDYTYVTVDTRKCAPVTTTIPPTISTTKKPTTGIVSTTTSNSTDNLAPEFTAATPEFMADIFDDLSNQTNLVNEFNASSVDLDISFTGIFNESFDDPFADPIPGFETATDSFLSVQENSTQEVNFDPKIQPIKNGSFVVHVSPRNRTVRPVYAQKPSGGSRIMVKSSSNRLKNNVALEQQGMEIV